jgi:DNA-binding LacI/PurR family transcriptional regulator
VSGARRPTIHDVADRAGVSKSLVSLVLRGAPNVSDHRRAAVERAITELGYRPSAAARSLVQRRTATIGVLVADLHNPFFAEVYDGLRAHATSLGYRTLLGSGDQLSSQEEETVETMLELRVDGLVLLSPRVSPRVLRDAVQTTPVVIAGSNLRVPRVDTVSSDEAEGTALAVAHLVGLGHRRIAHIAGSSSRRDPRREGYEAAMRASGLGARVRVIIGDHNTDEGGYESMRELLSDRRPPTAVLANNDLAAVGALGALDEAGIRVPEDISLVGYDNSYLAGIRHIGLTSVNQPRLEMGRLTMAALHRRITGGGGRARHEVLRPDLVVRSTTAPP